MVYCFGVIDKCPFFVAEYKRGKALQLTMDVFKAGSIVGWWKMYMTRRKDLLENIKFKPAIVKATQKILKRIASKVRISYA